jgi:translin
MVPPDTEQTADEQRARLRDVAEGARSRFLSTHGAREQALRLARDMISNSANSIRATHRGDFDRARSLLDKVSTLASEIEDALEAHPNLYYAGYVEDAQKEYTEASATLALVRGTRLPGPEDLGVGPAPYLNGLAETVGELRRFILDSLRRDDFNRCEELLDIMDEIYTALVTMDFPDAVTRGLRRSTDMVRGILERTRGDLTIALRQRRLEQKLGLMERETFPK